MMVVPDARPFTVLALARTQRYTFNNRRLICVIYLTATTAARPSFSIPAWRYLILSCY